MSATLIVLIPLALLGVVSLLGFVGCVFTTTGEQSNDPYDDLVKSEGSLIAFWTLTDPSGTTATDDGPNNFPGTYTGSVTLNQMPGIVPGDQVAGQPVDPCALFNGGVVSVPWQKAINISPPFSVEAWVLPGWSPNDPPALRGVVVSNSKNLSAGFGLFASTDNMWLVSLGMASTSIEVKPPAGTTIDFTRVTHLVAVYDSNLVCTIFANAMPIATMDTTKMGTYVPLPENTPLFIGAGAPDQGASPPQFPFTGKIQCVALYSKALDQTTIKSHFDTGAPG